MYTMHNPVRFVDPSGLIAIPALIWGGMSPGLGPGTGFVSSAVSIPILIPVPGHNHSHNPDGLGIPWLPAPSQSQVDAFHNVMNTIIENITTSIIDYVSFLANPFRGITLTRDAAIPRTIGDIARQHGLLECDSAAEAIAAHLTGTGHSFQFVETWFSGHTRYDYYIDVTTMGGGAFPAGTVISRTGWHVGINFNGWVYCNRPLRKLEKHHPRC